MGIWALAALAAGGLAGIVAAAMESPGGVGAVDGLPLLIGVVVAFFVLVIGVGVQVGQRKD